MHVLGPIGARFLESRKIDLETASRFGVYTGRAEAGGAVTADEQGHVVAFPFIEHGSVVAEKFRARGKKFWQRAGGRRTFWNADALDDVALENGSQSLIITEGEIDALTAIECGFPLTVSVPDGAPGVPKGRAPDELDPIDATKEAVGKFEYLWNNRDRLKRIKRFILAVDADAPGQRLAAELSRRLSAARCLFVSYPTDPRIVDPDKGPRGPKDLNEVLMHFGRDEVARVLNEAKPYPVRGLYRLSEYPMMGTLETHLTGWETLDRHFKIFRGELIVVTGIPGHGKSSLVTHLLINLAQAYAWRAAVCSPEMPVAPQYRDKMRGIKLGRRPLDRDDEEAADRFIETYFSFIDANPLDDLAEEITLDWVLERATDCLLRDGLDILVIDPWNELEHERRPQETTSEYVGRAIRVVKRWAKRHNVAVIIVAHPTKEVGKDGRARMPTPYDIDGAAHWFNKPDHILIIHREDEEKRETAVRIAKVRFEGTGEKGLIKLAFNPDNGRFGYLDDIAGTGPLL